MAGSGGSTRQQAHAVWSTNKTEVFSLVLGHPAAGVATLATLLRASFSLNVMGVRNSTATIAQTFTIPDQHIQTFLRGRIQQQGVPEVLRETLETWSDVHPVTWEIFSYLFV